MQRGVTDRNTGDAGVDGPRPRAVPRPVCGPAGACGRTRVPVGHSERWYRSIPPRSLGIHPWDWHVVRGSHYGHGPLEEIQSMLQLWGANLDYLLAGAHGTLLARRNPDLDCPATSEKPEEAGRHLLRFRVHGNGSRQAT